MNKEEFIRKYESYKSLTEKYLNDTSTVYECPQKNVQEAVRYSLMAGGKRIRPVFMLAFAELLSVSTDVIMPFAAAVEMIHTYSLIHDDLPSMDNDDLRRGKPTNHIVFGEATAILAGDALLNKAFELMLEACSAHEGDELKNAVSAMKIIAEASGISGMIAGQSVDMEMENKNVTEDELKNMCLNKTGAIIKASCLVPVILSCRENIINDIVLFSAYIGLMFQIKDDVLDATGSDDVLGKSAGSDRAQGKNTFVSLCGLEKCDKYLNEYMDNSFEIIDRIAQKITSSENVVSSEAVSFLKLLTVYLCKRNK